MKKAIHLGVLATIVVSLAIAAASCGTSESEEDRIQAAIEGLQDAHEAMDGKKACEHVTKRAYILVGVMGHDTPSTCADELNKVFRWLRGNVTNPPPPDQPDPELVDAEIRGNRAMTTIQAEGRPPVEAPFVKQDGKWRLDSVFGTEVSSYQSSSGYFRPSAASAYAKTAYRRPQPAANVSASHSGAKCSAVDTSRPPRLTGGCVLRLKGELGWGITSVFGTWRFDDPCKVRYGLRVDGQGRTWLRGLISGGHSPCPDIYACGKTPAGGDEIPWPGRIESGKDGSLYNHVEHVCLSTCLGLYRGDLRMKLVRSGPGWRLETSRSNVGLSGWQFNDTLQTPRSDVTFESS